MRYTSKDIERCISEIEALGFKVEGYSYNPTGRELLHDYNISFNGLYYSAYGNTRETYKYLNGFLCGYAACKGGVL
jgi:hypothetical protein